MTFVLREEQRKRIDKWLERNRRPLLYLVWALLIIIIEMVWWFAAINIGLLLVNFLPWWYRH